MSLAENASGKPIALSISIQQCQALTKNLSRGFFGKVFLAKFLSTEFIAKKTVYQGGSNSSCRTKCSEPEAVEIDKQYRLTEMTLEDYRFFEVVELARVH